jgi:hypothetical protein
MGYAKRTRRTIAPMLQPKRSRTAYPCSEKPHHARGAEWIIAHVVRKARADVQQGVWRGGLDR